MQSCTCRDICTWPKLDWRVATGDSIFTQSIQISGNSGSYRVPPMLLKTRIGGVAKTEKINNEKKVFKVQYQHAGFDSSQVVILRTESYG